MITNKGKTVVSKFLLGQTASYASHIAVGCGATPLLSTDSLGDYSAKQALDFEMFRIPIISRGYVYEDGLNKVVLTAELPTEERYEITELGLFSAGSNPSVLNDSKQIFTFSTNENWELHVSTTASALTTQTERLDIGNTATGNMATQAAAFFTTAENEFFNLTTRLARQERPRYLNDVVMIQGNLSGTITGTTLGTQWTYTAGASHIHLTNISMDLDKNSSEDELRLPLSIISTTTSSVATPTLKVLVEFSSAHDSSVKAQLQYTGVVPANNRYVVVSQKLGNMYKSPDFTWDSVTVAKVYISIDNSSSYYAAIDGLRLENLYSGNPLYGMTGYSVIRNTYTDSAYVSYAKPIIKNPNTSNYIEFRFAVGVS